jgi:hypothetical protein
MNFPAEILDDSRGGSDAALDTVVVDGGLTQVAIIAAIAFGAAIGGFL